MTSSYLECPSYLLTYPEQTTCGPVRICPGQWVTMSYVPGTNCTGYPDSGLQSLQSGLYITSILGCGEYKQSTNEMASAQFGDDCMDFSLIETTSNQTVPYGATMQIVVTTPMPSLKPVPGPPTRSPTTFAPTVAQGYLEISKSQTCDGSTLSGEAPMGPCVALYDSGRYARFSCYQYTESSPWTANIYLDPTCATTSLFQSLSGADGCDCVAFPGTYMTYSMTYSCNAQAASCGGGSSDDLSAAAIGGIAGGAAAVVIILVVVGLYVFGVLSCAASSSSAGTTVQAESTVNPIAAP